MDILKDDRSKCYSVMTTLRVGLYLMLVNESYKNKGGIEGQREALRTKTATRIRSTMQADFSRGAVLPPIVIGVVVTEGVFETIETINMKDFLELIVSIDKENFSIIDGMQRTTAIAEASQPLIADIQDPAVVAFLDRRIRVEFWIAHDINSLIYRMMVLNTGQVPWNLKRQVEVVFRALLSEIKIKLKDAEILSISDSRKRVKAGQYQANDLVELYLVFGTRKSTIDTKERLSDEFTRLDFIEATSDNNFTENFFTVLQLLVNLDRAFDKFTNTSDFDGRFCNGKDIFGSQPARAGFIASCAMKIFGRPGTLRPEAEQSYATNSLKETIEEVINKLDTLENESLQEYLDLETLNQVVERKSSKVGEYERSLFEAAFTLLLEEGEELDSLSPAWRAY